MMLLCYLFLAVFVFSCESISDGLKWSSSLSLVSNKEVSHSLIQVRQILVKQNLGTKGNELVTYLGGIVKGSDYEFIDAGNTSIRLPVKYGLDGNGDRDPVSRTFVVAYSFNLTRGSNVVSGMTPVWAVTSGQNQTTPPQFAQPLAHLAAPPLLQGRDEPSVYVTGLFQNSISFKGSSKHFKDSILGHFVTKLDVNGQPLWLETLPAVNTGSAKFWDQIPWPIACQFETLNHVAVVGTFLGRIELLNIDGEPVNLQSPNNTVSPYLLMFDKATGVILHASQGFGLDTAPNSTDKNTWKMNLAVDIEWDEASSKLFVAILQFSAVMDPTTGRFKESTKYSATGVVVAASVLPKKASDGKKPTDAGGYLASHKLLYSQYLGELPLVKDSWRRGEIFGLLLLRESLQEPVCTLVLYGHFAVPSINFGDGMNLKLDTARGTVGAFIAGFNVSTDSMNPIWAYYLPTTTSLSAPLLEQTFRISAGPWSSDKSMEQTFLTVFGSLPGQRISELVKTSPVLNGIKNFDTNTFVVCVDRGGKILFNATLPAVHPKGATVMDVVLKPIFFEKESMRSAFVAFVKSDDRGKVVYDVGIISNDGSKVVTEPSPIMTVPTAAVTNLAPTGDGATTEDESDKSGNLSDSTSWFSGDFSYGSGLLVLGVFAAAVLAAVAVAYIRNKGRRPFFSQFGTIPLHDFRLGSGRQDRGSFAPLNDDTQFFDSSMADIDEDPQLESRISPLTGLSKPEEVTFEVHEGEEASGWDAFLDDNDFSHGNAPDSVDRSKGKASGDDEWNWK